MVKFVPEWQIDAGCIATVVQGSNIGLGAGVTEIYAIRAAQGTFQVNVGNSIAAMILQITVNDNSIPFSDDQSGQEVVFSPLPYDADLRITRTTQATISLLNGQLPPGLSLAEDGTISGVVGQVFPDPQTFNFTLRATNEFVSRDRAFSIAVSGVSDPATFNAQTLPTPSSSPITSYPLGAFKIGQNLWFTPDIIQKDFDFPPLTLVHAPGLVETATIFSGLPPGIVFENGLVRGRIDIAAPPGLYVFALLLADAIQPETLTFSIQVSPIPLATVDVPLSLSWTTPSGSIGSIIARVPSCLGVAVSSNSASVVFSLSPLSGPLPQGLTIDPVTGAIDGIPAFVLGSVTSTFVLRATVGLSFIERKFSITVSSSFSTSDVGRVYALVDRRTSAREISAIATAIDPNLVFHPSDPNFGIQRRPVLHIVDGLSTGTSISNLTVIDDSALGQKTYYANLRFTTGELVSFPVVDEFGLGVFDAIVRLLHDPNAGAGGFIVDESSSVVPQQTYDRDNTVIRPVYPNSLQNIRYDLISRFGLQSSADLRYKIGRDSPELLPRWMNGSYILGIPLVYVLPGKGAAAIKSLQQAGAIPPFGNVIEFGHLFYERPSGVEIIQLV